MWKLGLYAKRFDCTPVAMMIGKFCTLALLLLMRTAWQNADAFFNEAPFTTKAPIQRSAQHQLFATHSQFSENGSKVSNWSFLDRRSMIDEACGLASSTLLLVPDSSVAATTTSSKVTSTVVSSNGSTPAVTHRISLDVRISRQDGTFYVRDDLDETIPENQVRYFTLQFGLFGDDCPKSVGEFLKYVDVKNTSPLDDDPLPSYGRSSFVALDQATGLLTGGAIPSLEVTTFGGSGAIKYGGRILPATLWGNYPAIRHTTKGLLTHRNLDISPTFGITTRPAPDELDGTFSVFGQVLLDNDGVEFLNVVEDLPTYSMERPRGDPRAETALDTVAADVFNAHAIFFARPLNLWVIPE